MNTEQSGRRHQIRLAAAPTRPERTHKRFSYNAAAGQHSQREGRRTALSPFAQLAWKLIAAGTEPGRAHGLLLAWPGWEYISHQIWPTTEIPGAPYGLLSMRVGPYSGEPVSLPGGIRIQTNALVGEIHCNNKALLRISLSGRVSPFAACREDLRAVAVWAMHDEIGRQVQALNGITILARGAARMGFSVRATPVTLRRRFERVFMTGLLLLYAPDGLERLRRGRTVSAYPQEIWISREELIRRYGDREPRLLSRRAETNYEAAAGAGS